jgi:hypothetical protein
MGDFNSVKEKHIRMMTQLGLLRSTLKGHKLPNVEMAPKQDI